jgi:branched-chain amino acid transport system ATP-binding protein
VLHIQDLNVSHGKIKALFGVSLQVPEGGFVVVVGNNGAGKTTLMDTVAGLLPVAGGSIEFQDRTINKLKPHERVKIGICLVPESREIFGGLSVRDNLKLGAFARKKSPAIEDDLENVYSYFPVLKERQFQKGGTLSGGEQRMLAIGRALLGKPRLLLLDEPSSGLAPLLVKEMLEIAKKLNEKEGVTIVLVEQKARLALPLAQFGYVLQNGCVLASGTPEKLLHDEQIRNAYLGG